MKSRATSLWPDSPLFGNQTYQQFVADSFSQNYISFIKATFDFGLSIDRERFIGLIKQIEHLVFLPNFFDLAPNRFIAPSFADGYSHTIVTTFPFDPASLQKLAIDIVTIEHFFLGTVTHEAKHLQDEIQRPDLFASSRWAEIEYRAWAEDFYFLRGYIRQYYPAEYNYRAFIIDHGPDNDYQGPVGRIFTDYSSDNQTTWNAAVAPLTSALTYISQAVGIPTTQILYSSSALASRNRNDGVLLQGYDFVFTYNGTSYNIFADLSGEWIYYNSQWTPNTARIAARLLDPTTITLAQYQDMVAYDARVTAGFVRLPSTYEALINNPPNQQMINDLKAAFDLAFSLDPQDFLARLNWIQHIVINSYGNTHGSGHAYPSTGTIILNSYFYSQLTLQPDRMFFLTDLVFHESMHLQDLVGNSSPTLRQFRMSERNAYAEMAHWELLERSLTAYALSSYAMNQFLADHIPDNDYNGVVAAAVSDSISLFPEAVASLTTLGFTPLSISGGFFQLNAGLTNLKYISSPIATMNKFGTNLSGYTFTFQKPDTTTVSAFVDLSGQWIYYNSQWFQWTTSGTQVSISQFDASGRLALKKQYDSGTLSWTQQYYYTGVNTTPDYSKRTYANGDIDYYNPGGQLFVDVLLTRQNFSRSLYSLIQSSAPYFASIPYESFISGTITPQVSLALKNLIALGMQTNMAQLAALVNSTKHIVLLPLEANPLWSQIRNTWYFSATSVAFGTASDGAIIFYADAAALTGVNAQQTARLALPVLVHDMAYFKNGIVDQARSEYQQYQESTNWMRYLNLDPYQISRRQWLTDRIPDNSYSGLAARFVTGNIQGLINPRTGRQYTYAEAEAAIMQPLESFLGILLPRGYPKTAYTYVSSPSASRFCPNTGTTLQGFNVTLTSSGMTFNAFVDITGEWIFYNGAWIHYVVPV
jgi:hypothetical protein